MKNIKLDLKEISYIYELMLYLKNYKINFHQIILNKDNQIIISKNNNIYVLMKIKENNNNKINSLFLSNFRKHPLLLDNKKLYMWRELWIEKIDYFEYQLNEYKKKYPLLYEISDYFIGMVEISIQLMNTNYFRMLSLNEPQYIAHKRINTNLKVKDLYDPFNIVIDSYLRDYGDYYKDEFFFGEMCDITGYIEINKLDNLYILFIRLLYITPFFDNMEQIIKEEKKEIILNKLIPRVKLYDNQLNKLYNFLIKKDKIIRIDYFENKIVI
ncbi:MAG: hypothetical protein RR847_05040 [Bacilli bacterium]